MTAPCGRRFLYREGFCPVSEDSSEFFSFRHETDCVKRDASVSQFLVMRNSGTFSANKSRRPATARIGRTRRQLERFDSLVDELSGAMARVSADEIDKEIEEWLRKIVLVLDIDRATVWERRAPDIGFISTHWWRRPGIPAQPDKMRSAQISPWATAQVLEGKLIAHSSPEELPKEAVKLRRFLKSYGPKAQVILPLQIGDLVLGILTFGKFRNTRHWSPKELRRLRIIGQIIAGALERKRADLRSRKLLEELAIASRRATMGELTASIAHELNRPLGAILSNLEGIARLLSQGNPQPALSSGAVRNAIEDTKRAAEIVRRFRSMFKSDETHKVAIDVRQLVNDVVKLVGREAAFRGIALRIDESTFPPRAMGDRIQIQQCVLNLLMNALDATAQTTSGPRDVTIRVAPEKSGWIGVSVCDTGAGIDASVANRVFEPFVTTKSKGMGLGLLVTRSIVEAHGGRISFTPNPGGGTTFTFTLPVAQGERARASRRAQ